MLTDKQRSDILLKLQEEDMSIAQLARLVRHSKSKVNAVIFDNLDSHFIEYHLVLWSQDRFRYTEDGNLDLEYARGDKTDQSEEDKQFDPSPSSIE